MSTRATPLTLDLSGRRALVTGGSGRLGRQIVRALARCGADVVIHYHRAQAEAEALEREVQAMGRSACRVRGDVGDARSVEAMAESALADGVVDILVLNAVVQIQPWQTLVETSVEDFESQFRSCVLHAALCARAFVPAMCERRYGRVIGINTECAMQMFETQSAYAAGKRGMDGALRVLAREVGQYGVTVNQVAPGWVAKPGDVDTEEILSYARQVPLRRRGTEEEVAHVVAFLASGLASYVHGAFVPVCGGNVMPTI